MHPPEARATPTPLRALAASTGGRVVGGEDTAVRDVHHDSRLVVPGTLFVARRGERCDGVRHVPEAIARGAVAVMADETHYPAPCPVPLLLVPSLRIAMARAAEQVYGEPSRELAVVGVTGTNGKTTSCYLLRAALAAAGARPAIMGTLGTHFEGLALDSRFNTPEADELARAAARLLAAGASHLIMEVTSIALHQHRTDGMRLRVGAFTNLTRDHLDYHGTLAAYGAAKARLVLELSPDTSVVQIDDPFGAELAGKVGGELVTVSTRVAAAADVRPAQAPCFDATGVRCVVATPAGATELVSPLLGEHNLANLLVALSAAIALGLPATDAARALGACPPVRGRLEPCHRAADEVAVYVDYAHTPDALERVLPVLRTISSGRIWCVFGCGGERDRGKRPLMGAAAARLADEVVVTTDNPRSEPPEDIANAIVQGAGGGTARLRVELDRAQAIALAISSAHPGDAVLVAGKGHETTQIVGSEALPFDDREQAQLALQRRSRADRLARLGR